MIDSIWKIEFLHFWKSENTKQRHKENTFIPDDIVSSSGHEDDDNDYDDTSE